MPQIKFTDTTLAKLSADKTTWFSDPSTKGLQLCVTAGGTKTWYVNRWDAQAQKVRRVKLGQWASKGTHCRWAKDQVAVAFNDVREGRAKTKAEVAQEQVGIPTLREAFDREMQYRRNRKAAYGGPIAANTDRDYCRAFESYLGKWSDIRMDEIDVGAIQRALDDLSEEKPFAAHKVNIVVGMTFARAARMIGAPLRVLTPKLDKNPTMQQREIDTSVAWADRWAEIESIENEVIRLFWMCRWYTGMRGDMLRKLKWADVDLDAGTAIVRTGLKKVKSERLIALSDQVKQWFERLSELRHDDCDWVFPSRRIMGDERGHMDQPDRLPLSAPGDMRHLWNEANRNVQCREAVIKWLCGQALNSSETKNLGLYGVVDVALQRRIANEIAAVIDQRIGRAPCNVVEIGRARA